MIKQTDDSTVTDIDFSYDSSEVKQIWLKLLKTWKSEIEELREGFLHLEDTMPEEDHWKILRRGIFWDELNGTVPVEVGKPSEMLAIAISAIQEYIESIEHFTADQFAAFLLGLGMSNFPLRYWGMEELEKFYKKIPSIYAHYEKLENELGENSIWKIERYDPFRPPGDLLPRKSIRPTELLQTAMQLAESMIVTLKNRPF